MRDIMIVTPPIKGFALFILSLLILTLLAACGGAGNQDFASARTDPETTLILAYDGWTGTYLSSYVLKAIFEDELGYQAKVAKQQDIPAAFESVSSGRTDIFTSAWFPARDSTLDKHPNLVRLGVVYGGKNKDAFEGWMVSGGLASSTSRAASSATSTATTAPTTSAGTVSTVSRAPGRLETVSPTASGCFMTRATWATSTWNGRVASASTTRARSCAPA